MKILVTDPIAEEAMDLLKKKHEVVFKDITGEDLIKEIPPYHALMVRSGTKVTREVIENAENLIVIGRAGIGVDNIDLDAATEKKIKVLIKEGEELTLKDWKKEDSQEESLILE